MRGCRPDCAEIVSEVERLIGQLPGRRDADLVQSDVERRPYRRTRKASLGLRSSDHACSPSLSQRDSSRFSRETSTPFGTPRSTHSTPRGAAAYYLPLPEADTVDTHATPSRMSVASSPCGPSRSGVERQHPEHSDISPVFPFRLMLPDKLLRRSPSLAQGSTIGGGSRSARVTPAKRSSGDSSGEQVVVRTASGLKISMSRLMRVLRQRRHGRTVRQSSEQLPSSAEREPPKPPLVEPSC